MQSRIKFKWNKYCVLTAASADNVDANSKIINVSIKDTKLYVPVVTLSAKDNQKLTKLLSKGSERSVYWNEFKTKNENKNIANEYRYFFESNFVGVNRLFVSVSANQDVDSKRLKTQRYYLPRDIIKSYNAIINGKNFYNQAIDSDIKRYELTIG